LRNNKVGLPFSAGLFLGETGSFAGGCQIESAARYILAPQRRFFAFRIDPAPWIPGTYL
jgi:hypothetical protein